MQEQDDYADRDPPPPLDWMPSREEMDLSATQGVVAAVLVMIGLMVAMAVFACYLD